MDYPQLRFYVDGRWLDGGGRETLSVVDPGRAVEIGRLPCATTEDVDAALEAARRTFPTWRATPANERSAILRRAAALMRDRVAAFSHTITLELGKPLAESVREVDVAAEMFEWAAEECRRLYGRIIPARTRPAWQMAVPEPIGPVAAFSGWNAPAITPSRKISGALAAGCSIVIKPAEETPASALFIARALADVDLPAGVLNMVFGNPAETARRMMESPVTRMVTFTGSTVIGRQLASLAAPGFKRTVLELGGHAPVLVFGDVDPREAARIIARAKFRNAGQICTSPTRIMVHASIADAFGAALAEEASSLRVGYGLSEGVQMGPVATERRQAAIREMIEDARNRGGRVLAGEEPVDDAGYYVRPTVIDGYDSSWSPAQVEPFGPLAISARFDTFEEALAEANRLPFGLAAYVFTHNTDIAMRAAYAIESGVVCINHCQHSWPETPFGGVKDSGLGKEGGVEGIAAFCQLKYVSQM